MVKGAFALYSARAPLQGDGSEDAPSYGPRSYATFQRNLFVFDVLMAEEILDALLAVNTGSTARAGLRQSKPATVHGYGRFCLRTEDPWLAQLPGALPAGPRVRIDLTAGVAPAQAAHSVKGTRTCVMTCLRRAKRQSTASSA